MNALVIIPTYNEAATVARVIRAVCDTEPRAEVLVVDDASPDGTAGIVQQLIDDQDPGKPRVHLLRRGGKQGLGAAYRAGFDWGMARSYDALVEMDADLSHPADQLPALLDGLSAADLTIGSRYVPGGATQNWSRIREAISRVGNLYVRLALRLPVRDATAGYRAYRRDLLASLPLDQIRSSGYCFQIEMAHRTWQQGGRIAEIPITFTEREAGHSKMSRKIVAEALWRVAVLAVTGGRRGPDTTARVAS